MKNNILITGVAGNIGSSLALALIKKNYNVIGVDNFLTGSKEKLPSNHIKILNFYMQMLIIKVKFQAFSNLIRLKLCFILLRLLV